MVFVLSQLLFVPRVVELLQARTQQAIMLAAPR
jgi:hypothetical protein